MKQNILPLWRRAASTLTKEVGDISSVFPSLSGKKADPLPPRFSELKKALIKGNEDAVKASWQRLLESLKTEVQEIKSMGSEVLYFPPVQSNAWSDRCTILGYPRGRFSRRGFRSGTTIQVGRHSSPWNCSRPQCTSKATGFGIEAPSPRVYCG